MTTSFYTTSCVLNLMFQYLLVTTTLAVKVRFEAMSAACELIGNFYEYKGERPTYFPKRGDEYYEVPAT